MMIFEETKKIPILDVARALNVKVGRGNFAKCCFHGEKTASLKLYPQNNSLYCFGCGASGSNIDLVMGYANLHEPLDAAKWIDDTFMLGLFDEKDNAFDLKRHNEIQAAKEKRAKEKDIKKWAKESGTVLAIYLTGLYYIKRDCTPESIDGISDEWVKACNEIPPWEHIYTSVFEKEKNVDKTDRQIDFFHNGGFEKIKALRGNRVFNDVKAAWLKGIKDDCRKFSETPLEMDETTKKRLELYGDTLLDENSRNIEFSISEENVRNMRFTVDEDGMAKMLYEARCMTGKPNMKNIIAEVMIHLYGE